MLFTDDLLSTKTQFTDNGRVNAYVGESEKIVYSSRFDAEGRLLLEPSGVDDVYGFIQSFKDSVDINKMLEMYTRGDTTALFRRQGVFSDFTNAPKSYAEFLNNLSYYSDQFNCLSLEEREKYGHSLERYLVSLDSPLSESGDVPLSSGVKGSEKTVNTVNTEKPEKPEKPVNTEKTVEGGV